MADAGMKRKASHVPNSSAKRTRTEASSFRTEAPIDENDDLEDDSYSDDDSSSEDNREPLGAETPLTPFSPSRKFPSELKTIKCTYDGCTKTFNRPARLQSHLRSHTQERPFKCSYAGCDKAYMQEKHLIQHVKGSHTHERTYSCDWDGCSKSFLTATRLRRHQAVHEGHERFRCTAFPPCNQTFRKHQTLQRHIRSDHLDLVPFPCTHVDPVTGVVCDAGFDSGGSLRKHEDRVHGTLRFFCEECATPSPYANDPPRPLGFTTKALLTKHIKTTHINCLFCDLSFSSQAELHKHTDTVHEPKPIPDVSSRKIVPCTYPGCDKTFTKKYNLTVHIRTVHNGERFICGIPDLTKLNILGDWDGKDACGKDFVSKVNLVDHVRTQHLDLPSTVNAKRIKKPKEPRKKRNGDKVSAIDLVTGAGYNQDGSRNIPCSVTGCPWLFTRDYDLQQHLETKHTKAEIEVATKAALASLDLLADQDASNADDNGSGERNNLDAMYDQADLDWELQQNASVGEPFWIGAQDSDLNTSRGDTWSAEEAEMRYLIDESSGVDAGYEQFIDPALVDA